MLRDPAATTRARATGTNTITCGVAARASSSAHKRSQIPAISAKGRLARAGPVRLRNCLLRDRAGALACAAVEFALRRSRKRTSPSDHTCDTDASLPPAIVILSPHWEPKVASVTVAPHVPSHRRWARLEKPWGRLVS